uniref:Uncharacterized protein n=1 Tax=Cacopsylla melanoneura TaxID=428564 RepID=A0A8D9EZ53_9HEMI
MQMAEVRRRIQHLLTPELVQEPFSHPLFQIVPTSFVFLCPVDSSSTNLLLSVNFTSTIEFITRKYTMSFYMSIVFKRIGSLLLLGNGGVRPLVLTAILVQRYIDNQILVKGSILVN